MLGIQTLRPIATYPDLEGKTVLITGGSKGIGASAAKAFAANGTSVVIVGRDQGAIDRTVEMVSSYGALVLGVAADCTKGDELTALRETINREFGPVDIVAAFAGGNGMPVGTESETVERSSKAISPRPSSPCQRFCPTC